MFISKRRPIITPQDEYVKQNDLSVKIFERVDRITNLCDMLSFSLCFDVPATGEISIFPRNEQEIEVSVQYHVEDGAIHVNPWPFSVDFHSGYLVAYRKEGYPEATDPVILPYRLEKN